MIYYKQNYELYLWSMENRDVVFHEWDVWKKLFNPIDKILALSKEQTSIHSFQSRPESPTWLGFGRMSWTLENNKKWCCKYQTGKYSDGATRFSNTQIWASSRNLVHKGKAPLDVFIKTDDAKFSRGTRQTLLIAINDNFAKKHELQLNEYSNEISSILPNTQKLKTKRGWAESVHENSYSNGLENAFLNQLWEKLNN